MMRLGGYDQKIKFKSFEQVSNGSGGWIPTEVEVLSTWARIGQLKQSRNIEQVQMGLPSTYRVGVQVRKNFEPTIAMVVEWKGSDYQIITSPTVENCRTGQEWVFDITKPNNG
ncbi:phage head closure protein [Sphingobacterium sp.]|uniref:phage head closure protein n=1 Tax=Sphingobacterium sp. TaxID=341027 RepID=UPI00289CBD0A|nr:phage head closure protein [Sphingobacterium sp.]